MRMQRLPCNIINFFHSILERGTFPRIPIKYTGIPFLPINESGDSMQNWKYGLLLIYLMFSYNSYASYSVNIDGGMVHLKGSLIAPACSVSTKSKHQIIDLGVIRSNQLADIGSLAPGVPFSLYLSNCDTNISKYIGVTFWGNIDNDDAELFSLIHNRDSAKGVGLAIFDLDGNIIVPNKKSTVLNSINNGNNQLTFVARYRATQYYVIGGKADSIASFSLTYP